jgi:hypothetical protein
VSGGYTSGARLAVVGYGWPEKSVEAASDIARRQQSLAV